MPRYTEARIQQLCAKALASNTPKDSEQIIQELRAALEEHIALAKESLEVQRGNFPLLDKIARKAAGKKR